MTVLSISKIVCLSDYLELAKPAIAGLDLAELLHIHQYKVFT